MLTVRDIINSKRRRAQKPDEQELRKLPDRRAVIQGRLSGFAQVKESRESVLEIAGLVDVAREDGYQTSLDRATIERWLEDIQKGASPPGTREDGRVTVNCLGLGVSGALPEDKRPDLKLTMELLKKGELGAIYVTEGANRLSRDPDRVVSATVLKLMKETNCKLRTPREVLSPCIERDWEIIHDELERGADELKTMNTRLYRRRARKAGRGEFVGEPVMPGFIVPVVEEEPNGRLRFGKLQPYPPHAGVDVRILEEFVKQGGSWRRALKALEGVVFPFFPDEYKYMERLSSLRSAPRTEKGYAVTKSIIHNLATNPKSIGIWHWGDMEPILNNHPAIVPEKLFLEAYSLASARAKPRGRGIRNEPLEWAGLLYCCNHDIPERISGHPSKGAYRCQLDYTQGRGPSCLDVSARYIDRPLTATVLKSLDFTPLAEEVLMKLEADVSRSGLEAAQREKEKAALKRRLERIKQYLGDENPEREEFYWEQIGKIKKQTIELESLPVDSQKITPAHYAMVREFLSGLPKNWGNYSRTNRNRLLRLVIERVDLRHRKAAIEATLRWKTGQSQTITITRVMAKSKKECAWSIEELDTLKRMWPKSSKESIVLALPDRSWKSITHQGYKHVGKRSADASGRNRGRRPWGSGEEKEIQRLYEGGTPLSDIESQFGRSRTAVYNVAAKRGWERPIPAPTRSVCWSLEQNPEVSNEGCLGRGYRGWG